MIIRKSLASVINDRRTVILAAIISLILSFLGGGGISFLVLILFTLIVLWVNRWDWGYFGLKKDNTLLWLISRALLWTLALVIFAFLVRPLLESLFGPQDLSYFDSLRGNLSNYLITLFQVWLIVAFFEEFVYRGYILQQFERLFLKSRNKVIFAVILSSIVFGFAHSYQGTTGIIFSGLIGFILGLIFYFNNKNLWLTILIHGLVDTTYLTLVYSGYDLRITEMLATYLNL